MTRERLTSRARSFVPLVLMAMIVFVHGLPAAASTGSVTDSLQAEVDSLRVRAEYAEAVGVAHDLLTHLRSDAAAKPYQLADAEWLLKTVEVAAACPESVRMELMWGDQLQIRSGDPQVGDLGPEEAIRQLVRIRANAFGEQHPEVADALSMLGDRLARAGDYAGAEAVCREALAMRRKLLGQEHPDVASSLDYLGVLLRTQGDHVGAEPMLREALAMRRKLLGEEHRDVAASLDDLAGLYFVRGDYAGAEAVCREALAMRRKLLGQEHPDVASSLNNLAVLLQFRGDYAGAEKLFREALAMMRKLLGREHAEVATSLSNLANVLEAQGDYAGAEPLYREALAMKRKLLGEEHPEVAKSLNNLAVLLHRRGDYASAEPLYREALAMMRKVLGAEHPDVAGGLNNLAVCVEARGDYAGAEPLYREALAMKRKLLGEEHPQVAIGLNNLAGLLEVRGDLAGAELLYRQALAMGRKLLGEEHPEVAKTLKNLALLLQARGDSAAAESLCREALNMMRKLLGEHPYVAGSLRDLAYMLQARGDYVGAESLLVKACSAYDAARLRAGTGMARAKFLRSPYALLAATELALGRPKQAWPAAERDLGRTLFDLLVASRQRSLSDADSTREESLLALLRDLEGRLLALQSAARRDSADALERRIEETRTQLFAAEAEWSAFQRELAERYPLTEGQSYPLRRVQASLEDESALVGWVQTDLGGKEPSGWGYVIRNQGPVRWTRLPSVKDGGPSVAKVADGFRWGLASGEGAGGRSSESSDPDTLSRRERTSGVWRYGAELWRTQFAPLIKDLEGVTELVVIPSGALLGIPVEAIADSSGRFLGERFAVSYIPSATIYAWLTEQEQTRVPESTWGTVLLVGDPPFGAGDLAAMEIESAEAHSRMAVAEADRSEKTGREGLAEFMRGVLVRNAEALGRLGHSRLPATRREVQTIGALYPQATVLLGSDASEQSLVRLANSGELSRFSILHIATHAFADNEQPERSSLVLAQVGLPDALAATESGERIYDGMVSAQEILREWKLDADLVILSACDTGLGAKVAGEGYVGLAHALFQVGARSVVVSMWKVEDAATGLLMVRFHENLSGARGERMSRV